MLEKDIADLVVMGVTGEDKYGPILCSGLGTTGSHGHASSHVFNFMDGLEQHIIGIMSCTKEVQKFVALLDKIAIVSA